MLLNNLTPLHEDWAVWEIAANGTKEPEMIIPQGLLIDYVAVWATP